MKTKVANQYFYQIEHARIRETYSWETILRHEQLLMRALRIRYYKLLGEEVPESAE